MENSKVAALVELGILCRGEQIPAVGDGAPDPGPHRFSGHDQLCAFEQPQFRHPFENTSVEAFALFPPETTVREALAKTRLVVLLGLADSPEMRACLAAKGAVVVLFEPDERALIGFLEKVRLAGLNRDNLFCFTGDPRSFNPALQDMLPGDMFRLGTPAFFVTDRVRELYGGWARGVIEYFETLHYRHAVYGLSGQTLSRSRPLRDIQRGLIYDQQFHAFENIPDYLAAPDISRLRNRLRGTTALLVAAGPDLASKYDYIRRNRDRAVVICVNNAVKPLAEAGIHPHFVIINDTSLASGQVFDHIPRMPDTVLVAHCLSALGGDRFGAKYLFGSFLPQVFGERPGLELHGSVISTAFSLARHLGCGRCVLIGAQLSSRNPWALGYAKGTLNKDAREQEKPLVGRYPQLYPVDTPFGDRLYTTLNFLDAALWLTEVIRLSGGRCVNTARESILYGEGITHDPEPEPEGELPPMKDLFRPEPPRVNRTEARKYLRHETALWTSVRDAAATVLADRTPAMAAKGMAILRQLDASNVTYLVERFETFRNPEFHRLVFRGTEEERRKGLVLYYDHVLRMSRGFLDLLARAAKAV